MNKKLDPSEVQAIVDEHVPGIAKALEETLARAGVSTEKELFEAVAESDAATRKLLNIEPADGYTMEWLASTAQTPEGLAQQARTRQFLDSWITPNNGPFSFVKGPTGPNDGVVVESSDRVLASKHRGLTSECQAKSRAQIYHETKLARNGFHGARRPRDYQIPLLTSLTLGNGLRTTGFDYLPGVLNGGISRGDMALYSSNGFPMVGGFFSKTNHRLYMYEQARKKGLKIGYICDETMEADTTNIWDMFYEYCSATHQPGNTSISSTSSWEEMEGTKDFHYQPLSRVARFLGFKHPKLPVTVVEALWVKSNYGLGYRLSVAPIGAYRVTDPTPRIWERITKAKQELLAFAERDPKPFYQR